MTTELCQRDVALLLARHWQIGATGPTLPGTQDKLEKHCRSYRRNRRAAAAVEFAIVAPEGARQAVLDGATTAEVNTIVNSYLTSGPISSATVTVVPSPPTNADFGDPVTVEVSVPFSQVSWLPSPMYLGGKTLTAMTVMRRESVQ